MTLLQKLLLWFADYRELRDQCQRQQDEIIVLRGRAEEAERRADKWAQDSVNRERELNKQLFGIQAESNRRERPTITPTEPDAVAKARHQLTSDLEKYVGVQMPAMNHVG